MICCSYIQIHLSLSKIRSMWFIIARIFFAYRQQFFVPRRCPGAVCADATAGGPCRVDNCKNACDLLNDGSGFDGDDEDDHCLVNDNYCIFFDDDDDDHHHHHHDND